MAELDQGTWVKLLRDGRYGGATTGRKGDLGWVSKVMGRDVLLVINGVPWWHRQSDVEFLHTDADLAMALQLARLVDRDACEFGDMYASRWLVECVENELLSRGAR